ncbi:MAG: hypothetical protein U9N36_08570 [Euryarchaeota archaeon]|nr:hypothetical protein [Euryarchaeota archaeon]
MTAAVYALENILEYLDTGGWIAVEEVTRHIGITPAKSMKILGFLSEFGFIAFDSDNKTIKLIDHGERFIKLPES